MADGGDHVTAFFLAVNGFFPLAGEGVFIGPNGNNQSAVPRGFLEKADMTAVQQIKKTGDQNRWLGLGNAHLSRKEVRQNSLHHKLNNNKGLHWVDFERSFGGGWREKPNLAIA